MSAYVSQSDLERALGGSAQSLQLFDDNTTGSTSDPVYVANVADVIARASGEVDGYVQQAYALPLSGAYVTAALKQATLWLAMSLAGDRRPQFRDGAGRPVYHVQREYALAWLTKLGSGEVQLEGAPPTPTPLRATSPNPPRGWYP